MVFHRFPDFLVNEWANGMEIGSFGIVSKTFVMKRISHNEAFSCGMQGNGLK